jgi:O-methyltransferase
VHVGCTAAVVGAVLVASVTGTDQRVRGRLVEHGGARHSARVTYGVVIGERGDPERWKNERKIVRRGPGTPMRALQTLRHLATRDREAVLAFLRAELPMRRRDRLALLVRFARITNALRGYHTLSEMLAVSERVLRLAAHRHDLRVIECGAGSGASTAKLSLVVRAAGGRLDVYDSFRGIPKNDERHELLDGTPLRFLEGAFRGRLGAVERRVRELGAAEVCTFTKGLFEDTLPHLEGPVDVALLDVDLVASTRTCLRAIAPRLRPGGCILSQDGHLRATHALLADAAFFAELGLRPPRVRAIAGGKLLELTWPRAPDSD